MLGMIFGAEILGQRLKATVLGESAWDIGYKTEEFLIGRVEYQAMHKNGRLQNGCRCFVVISHY